jgi:hypothetical protein
VTLFKTISLNAMLSVAILTTSFGSGADLPSEGGQPPLTNQQIVQATEVSDVIRRIATQNLTPAERTRVAAIVWDDTPAPTQNAAQERRR